MAVKILHLPILPLWACKVRRPRRSRRQKESQAARASLGVRVLEFTNIRIYSRLQRENNGVPFQAVRGPASALTAGWGRWRFEMPCYYHSPEWDNV